MLTLQKSNHSLKFKVWMISCQFPLFFVISLFILGYFLLGSRKYEIFDKRWFSTRLQGPSLHFFSQKLPHAYSCGLLKGIFAAREDENTTFFQKSLIRLLISLNVAISEEKLIKMTFGI